MTVADKSSHLLKGALASGVINAIINGIINWFTVKDQARLLLTGDLISSDQHTVFAGAVPLAVSLAFILTTVAYFTTKEEGKPSYFPSVFVIAIKHSIYAFGLVVIFAILLQRIAGAIEVTPVASAFIAGIIAGLVGGIVDYETKRRLIAHD